MNPASVSFFLPREVSVLSMAQVWRTGLRMWCSRLYCIQRVATPKEVERELI